MAQLGSNERASRVLLLDSDGFALSAQRTGLSGASLPGGKNAFPGFTGAVLCDNRELEDAGQRFASLREYLADLHERLSQIHGLVGGRGKGGSPSLGHFAEAQGLYTRHEGLHLNFDTMFVNVANSLQKASQALSESAENYRCVEDRNRMSAERVERVLEGRVEKVLA